MEKLSRDETRKVNGGGNIHRIHIYKPQAKFKGYVVEEHIPRWCRHIPPRVKLVF